MPDNITSIYDKIFKRIITLSNPAVIQFINGVFGRSLPLDNIIVYNWTENINDTLDKTIADTILTIGSNSTLKYR